MSNELTIRNNFNLKELEIIGEAMVKSGYFADTKQTAQALVKILAGREMGFEPFTSMNGVHVIQGKPVTSANLMAAAVKRTNRYNYNIKKMDDNEVIIEFLENRGGKFESVGTSSFSIDEATKAGLAARDNWKKYPRNMLFARAISNGIKWFCPDALNGNTAYTPDEMGATEDGDGHIIDITPVVNKETVEVTKQENKTFNIEARKKEMVEMMTNETDLTALKNTWQEFKKEAKSFGDKDFITTLDQVKDSVKEELVKKVSNEDIQQ